MPVHCGPRTLNLFSLLSRPLLRKKVHLKSISSMHLGRGFMRDNPGPTLDFRASLSQAEALLRKYKQSASPGQRQAQIPAKTPSRPITQRGTQNVTDTTAPGRVHSIRELTPLDGPKKLGLSLSLSTTSPQSVAQTDTLSQRQHGRPTQQAAEGRAEQQLAAAREGSAALAAGPGSRGHQPASQWQSPATSGQWAPSMAPSTTSGLSLGALAQLQFSSKQAGWRSSMPSVAARPSSQPAAHRVSKHADEAPEHPAQEVPVWEQSESGTRAQQEQPLGHPPGASEASLQELQSAISATEDLYAMLGEGQVVQLGSPASSWSAAGSGSTASSPCPASTGQQPARSADAAAVTVSWKEPGHQPASLLAEALGGLGRQQHRPATVLAATHVSLGCQDTQQQDADGGELPAAWEDAAAATDSLYALLGGSVIAQADSSSDTQSQADSPTGSKLPAEALLDRAGSVGGVAAPAPPAQQWEEQELHAQLPAQHSVAVQAGTPHPSYQLLFDATALQPGSVSQPTPTQSTPYPLRQLGLVQIPAGPHAGSTQQAFSSIIGAELLGKGSVQQWLQDVQLQDLFRLQLEGIRHQANKLRSQSSAGSTALARAAASHSYQYEFCSDIQHYIKATLPFPELS